MQTIQARISDKLLSKVDRLFSNSTRDLFIEILQNARRAQATRVKVSLERIGDKTKVIVEDDGVGIEDFTTLLCLGDSDWDPETAQREDPAGMGFFALLHTGVEVESLGSACEITPEVFRGLKSAIVHPSQDFVQGARLTFARDETEIQLIAVLEAVSLYGRTPIYLNGRLLKMEDFLKDCVAVREYKGVRFGIATKEHSDRRWNFYGRELRDKTDSLIGVLPGTGGVRSSLYLMIDVLNTSLVHLKLPDRTAVVEDHGYEELMRQGRRFLLEYLAALPEHIAPFKVYKEAVDLGIAIAEASPYLARFQAEPRSSEFGTGWFGSQERKQITRLTAEQLRTAIVVEIQEELNFTLEMAGKHFAELPGVSYTYDQNLTGYRWFDLLPRYGAATLEVQPSAGAEFVEVEQDGRYTDLTVVHSIRFRLEIQQPGPEPQISELVFEIPFAAIVDEGYPDGPVMFVTTDSEWVRREAGDAAAPKEETFSLLEAAQFVGFSYSDDWSSDSYESQLEAFVERMERSLAETLGGRQGALDLELNRMCQKWEFKEAARQAGVSQVRFFNEDGKWKFALGGQ